MSTSAHLTFGKVLRVSDLPHNEKLKFLTDANQPVAHVTSVKEEVVAAPEAVAAEAGAAPAEPEVIKKGKAETEEEGESCCREAGKEGREEGEEMTAFGGPSATSLALSFSGQATN